MLEAENWKIVAELYKGHPIPAVLLAHQLAAIKQCLQRGRKGIPDAVAGLDLAVEALYPHTDFHKVSHRLYLRRMEGVQKPEISSNSWVQSRDAYIMMRSVVLPLILLLPDRLPSLIVLVGFWIPPAVAGWAAAEFLQRSTNRARARLTIIVLAIFVLGYAAAWFYFNLGRMPPYIPGASRDPTFAPPQAVAGLLVVASGLVLPGSALVCALTYRLRRRMLRRTFTSSASA